MPSVRLRRDGYRAALERRGLPYDPELESGDLSNYTSVYEWVVAVMRKPIARPTAFFCWNDATALRSLMALQDMNIRVPEEVSLVGFDDDPAASYSHPSLTTLRQPYREIGEQAVEGLLARIDDYNAPPPRIVLPARLIIRDSTAPPPV
jgi:DNA-binding LacI/PurR family transcriptional regulator